MYAFLHTCGSIMLWSRTHNLHLCEEKNICICIFFKHRTSVVFGKQTISFLNDLACRVCKVSGEVQSFSYLIQRLTVCTARNAVSVLGALFLRTVTHIKLFSYYIIIVITTTITITITIIIFMSTTKFLMVSGILLTQLNRAEDLLQSWILFPCCNPGYYFHAAI